MKVDCLKSKVGNSVLISSANAQSKLSQKEMETFSDEANLYAYNLYVETNRAYKRGQALRQRRMKRQMNDPLKSSFTDSLKVQRPRIINEASSLMLQNLERQPTSDSRDEIF
ncbi:uncharacterized protein BDCG_06228 [Blastomyces dermatitidis ER-3]|uniref:Uncharacterized protein n=1 Tax=Ajellomyces dermatitidis (strain ER-3 / ATCC MYA-2586) TaxID=559297 RepID=A0ABP2F6C4_AJEDR|nr:uncharacterized protein BDCG_06228 [Blastomyces dermatitidis ER-3]EEQ91108.2 hypothetical protein BDCG_06228 [Blastomyces dermatitidis ER-3]EQL29220.1 hypothetical protein BDFG_08129 [Blastomyces dermatitidis ATCC 26199]